MILIPLLLRAIVYVGFLVMGYGSRNEIWNGIGIYLYGRMSGLRLDWILRLILFLESFVLLWSAIYPLTLIIPYRITFFNVGQFLRSM